MEYEIKPPGALKLGVRELWQYRELFYFFTWRDIKVKYKQTVLGFSWAVLQPLLMMLVFSFFFGKTLKVPSDNLEYPVFVFSGLLLWNIFSAGITNAGSSMINNAHIIKKIYFPRLIIPFSTILSALFDFLMSCIVYIGILFYYKPAVTPLKFLMYAPLSVAITVTTAFGAGAMLAALNVKYRDIRYIIPFLVQSLLFITPVIYPVSIIDNRYAKFIMGLNPLTGAIELFRAALGGRFPDWTVLILGMFTSLLILAFGLYYFRKTEAYFADIA
jgi:lipopolysaccharide transport system permease protein